MYLMSYTSDTSIKDIQKEFNTRYPSLWIDFFYKPDFKKAPFSISNKVNPEKKIKDLNRQIFPEPINISEDRTVLEIMSDFKKILGLEVRILRKSGNLWIGTPLTNDWTLEHQNFEGSQLDLSNENI